MAELSRRTFLKVSAATTGGLMLGTSLNSEAHSNHAEHFSSWKPDAWLNIHPDDTIEFTLARVEMGQGTMTGLTTLLAEELDIDPERLSIIFAPPADDYRNPSFRVQLTGGSNSLSNSWLPIREAGASARILLIKAASQQWSVDKNECTTENGYVIHAGTSQRLSYGELAKAAALIEPPERVSLKENKSFKYIGKSSSRLDAKAKTFATAKFGIDVKVPDMLHAVVIRPPVFGSVLKYFDAGKASQIKGFIKAQPIDQGLAIVAEKYWQAKKAQQLIQVEWHINENMPDNTEAIFQQYQNALDSEEGDTVRSTGETLSAIDNASHLLEAEYQCPLLAHATMEPQNCVADVTSDRCDIWAPTQGPDVARGVASRILNLDQEQIHVHTTYIGGGFGRRIVQDYVKEAVAISKALGKPIKLIWSREDDTRHDQYRPASLHRLTAALDDLGLASSNCCTKTHGVGYG